ncbi:MAG: hypothetical protein V2I57_13850 [Xanthomonadales bacterium]|jgi:hypothetical protein|nr:hypothetical protein [Xanthomonadales bacterium]
MLRNIGAVILGIVVGMIVNIVIVQINLIFFPLPEGVDPADYEALKAAMPSQPATAWIGVIAAHLGQAFVGGWVAARVGASRPVLLAMIVGVFTLAGGIANAVMLSPPAWTLIELPLYLVVAWLAGKQVEKSRAGAAG